MVRPQLPFSGTMEKFIETIWFLKEIMQLNLTVSSTSKTVGIFLQVSLKLPVAIGATI